MVTVSFDSRGQEIKMGGYCCCSLQASTGQHPTFSLPSAGPSALPTPVATLTYTQAVDQACCLLEGAVVGRQLREQREGGCMARQWELWYFFLIQ